jgi:hypothetical protein
MRTIGISKSEVSRISAALDTEVEHGLTQEVVVAFFDRLANAIEQSHAVGTRPRYTPGV